MAPPDNKSGSEEGGGNALALKKAQLTPCTVVLYDKGGTNQRAGCLALSFPTLDHPPSYSFNPRKEEYFLVERFRDF